MPDRHNICIGLFWTLLVVTCLMPGTNEATPAKPPNILFILADDYGWNDVGYHGSEILTPTLDRLAAEGVKLENYYVQPICSPTCSQLLSGRYQIHTGLQHNVILPPKPNGLPLEDPTLPDKLREAGYSTHIVGKWHIGYYKKEFTPTYRGFDSFFGYLNGEEDYYNHNRCYDFETKPGNFNVCGLDLHADQTPLFNYSGRYSTYLFAERAQQVAKEHVESTPDKPLFLYLPFQAVHSPMEVPEHYKTPYNNLIKNSLRHTYAGMVSCLDEAVYNVTEAFKKYGLWNNTLLVFSTDNGGIPGGGGNNWPLRGHKDTLWEGGLRGVGFVHSALLPHPGSVNRELVHVSDWLPTLVRLAGGSTAHMKLDGFDMWETISLGKPSPRKELLHNIDPVQPPVGKPLFTDTFDTRVRAAIRVGNWKLVTGDAGPSQWYPPPQGEEMAPQSLPETPSKNCWLFDIHRDPYERRDLSEDYPAMVHFLLQRLQHYNSTAMPCRWPEDDPEADPRKHGGVWVPWQD